MSNNEYRMMNVVSNTSKFNIQHSLFDIHKMHMKQAKPTSDDRPYMTGGVYVADGGYLISG